MNCVNLRSVVTSQNLQKIGDRAFYGCIALDSFNYDRSSEKLSYLGYEVFTNTRSMTDRKASSDALRTKMP